MQESRGNFNRGYGQRQQQGGLGGDQEASPFLKLQPYEKQEPYEKMRETDWDIEAHQAAAAAGDEGAPATSWFFPKVTNANVRTILAITFISLYTLTTIGISIGVSFAISARHNRYHLENLNSAFMQKINIKKDKN